MSELFHITHDSDDFSEYDNQPTGGSGSEIELSAASALGGSAFGLEIDADGTNDSGDKDFNPADAATELRLGFRTKLNTMSIASGDFGRILTLSHDAVSSTNIELENNGSGPVIIVEGYFEDAGFNTLTGTTVLTNSDTTVEIVITRAASAVSSDGVVEIFISGILDESVTGIDNYNTFLDYVSTGQAFLFLEYSGDAANSGVLYLDEIIIRDDSTIIYPAISHIWLSTDGGATYTDIGDSSAWAANLVGGVVVVPGTAYQTIFAAVGTSLYKTINGGTAWTLETAVGYEVDFIDLEKDNTTVFLAKRDAAGANRASLWSGSVLTHINTGKSTTGGATSGGDVV